MEKTKRTVECVPNFSEGRDPNVINAIAEAVRSVDGVRLLNIDPGEATNRTVYTFVGSPDDVCEAAFRSVNVAGELIDMRRHTGEHPRIGATDVLPIVPVDGISLEECAELARRLARRIADELAIPCYCYEAAALKPEHKNLADCRKGEYEGIAKKLSDPVMCPDYGGRPYDERIARTGCTVVGARDFLIAVNFNLNNTSAKLAHDIACDVRERGHGGKPGTLKGTKAIGWFIEEYGIAQVSMNICDIHATPLHTAFEEVSRCAALHGAKVTGTEIIGLVPKRVLIDAGRFYTARGEGSGTTERELIDTAVRAMGLSELCEFRAEEKMIG